MKKHLTVVLCCFCVLFVNAQKQIVVDKGGHGDYATVQAAIDAVPENNTTPIVIEIKNGTYKERVTIAATKRFITLHGENKNKTILTYDNHTGLVLPNGDTVNTYTSASMFVYADNFAATDITVQNNAGFNAGQAVALDVRADKATFVNCNIVGFQDVLFCNKPGARQYYKDCFIEGTTDFIFGPSTCIFQNCLINSKKNSHVTAASTPQESAYGFVFFNCTLTADNNVDKVSLGRPWRPYASVTYINCKMDKHILPEGWNNWKNPANELTARFAEYKSTGAGANISQRAKWSKQLTDEDAKQFTMQHIFGDWKP